MRKAKLALFLFPVVALLAWVRVPGPGGSSPAVSSGAYSYSRTLTTAHAQAGSSDSLNFSVLVRLDASNMGTTLKAASNGGHIQHTVTQIGGVGGIEPADLVFGTAPGCATLLAWETEAYDGSAGSLVAWVKIPTLSVSGDNVFYTCYASAATTTQQNTGSYAPSAVWAGNIAVWHLGNSLSLVDSTGNGNALTNNAGVTATTGQIAGGANFPYGNELDATLATVPSQYTISAWVKGNTGASYSYMSQLMLGVGGGSDLQLFLAWGSPTSLTNSMYADDLTGTVSTVDNTWAYVATTMDAAKLQSLYSNGVWVASRTASNFYLGTGAVRIGGSSGSYYWNGQQDEIRVSGSAKSASWITAEYNNQKSGSTFLTVGGEY